MIIMIIMIMIIMIMIMIIMIIMIMIIMITTITQDCLSRSPHGGSENGDQKWDPAAAPRCKCKYLG